MTADALDDGAVFRESEAPWCPEMVVIPATPAGGGWIGAPAEEVDREASELPRTRIHIPRLALGRTAVTRGQFRAFMAAWGESSAARWADLPFPQDDEHPAVRVTWHEAVAFCRWLAERLGRPYRLPSEAEWEWAARGDPAGTGVEPFPFPLPVTPDRANYDGRYTYADGPAGAYRRGTVAADAFPPNRFGLCQMSGNVWEWCADVWHADHRGHPGTAEPRDGRGADDDFRVVRGGSWDAGPNSLRAARRVPAHVGEEDYGLGFRVALGLAT